MSSRVVAFDPVSDLAILRITQDLGEPMPLGEATVGAAVALVAFDENTQPVERHLTVQQLIRATGKDIYGDAGTGRDALILEGSVARGNSGGPSSTQKARSSASCSPTHGAVPEPPSPSSPANSGP